MKFIYIYLIINLNNCETLIIINFRIYFIQNYKELEFDKNISITLLIIKKNNKKNY